MSWLELKPGQRLNCCLEPYLCLSLNSVGNMQKLLRKIKNSLKTSNRYMGRVCLLKKHVSIDCLWR